jgi:uncharacterized Zn-finger protein
MKNTELKAKQQVISEIIVVSHNVSCNGGNGALGHPEVYLTIPEGKNSVVCPYCSRKFIFSPHHTH